MSGVTEASANLLVDATLSPQAALVASWQNGFPFVVTRGRHVVGVNVYVASAGYWVGDVPRVLHNAAFWSAIPAFVSASPTTGVVPAGARVQVAVNLDATGLNRGNYDARLALTSNDPDESRVIVPVRLTIPCTGTGVACAPLALCHDVTVPANGLCRAQATATEVDGGSRDGAGRPVVLTLQPAGPFALGATPVTLTVTDQDGESSTCSAIVNVVDVSPPELSVTLSPATLWPPNHRMVRVTATVAAHDNCGPPSIVLVSVRSSETDFGHGNTANDVQQATPGTADFVFLLRAERAAGGSGRVYTAIYRAMDSSGNTALAAGTAAVGHR
jgi:hypothetical protein